MTALASPVLPLENGYHESPEPNGNGVNGNGTSPAAAHFDTIQFQSYLLTVLPDILGAKSDELSASLFDDDFDERVSRFASEGESMLYVQKVKEDADYDGTPIYSYHLVTTLVYAPRNVNTIALIKRTPVLDPSVPLAAQVNLLNLFGGENTPYESLHAVISQAVKPWFEAFAKAKSSGKVADSRLGIPVTVKKFAEVELQLKQLQENVEIPETDLLIHPLIKRAVETANAQHATPSISFLPQQYLTDSTFLNTLQGHVNMWIKSIQAVTKLSREVHQGTASQEIHFWLSMETALENIEAQLRSDEVNMVLGCLRNAKRYHATVSFIADTGLKEATAQVHDYNQLMKDFPLNDLLSATDLDKIKESIVAIFLHLNRKLRLSPYPIKRALALVEAISKDFNDQLVRVLTAYRLTYTPYDTFERLLAQTEKIFKTWDDQVKEFTNVAREVTRRRSERFIVIKVNPAHAKLMERTRYLRTWRQQHEQLALMTGPTKGLGGVGKEVGGMDMEEEVKEAYELIKTIDVLDASPEGTEIWVTAENLYNERVARVENQIIARLRDRLGAARNANEMFRVFSKFNSLFVRPKIRGAIQEYQTQLIESVKEDIKRLHDKFRTQYRHSEAYHMSQMRDLPPIAGAIIWARQIERQLSTYMKRVEDVLGKGWELYAEGQKLQAESVSFRRKLDTRPVFEAWLNDINRRDMGISGRLFEIMRLRGGTGYQLVVNFDPQTITLFKETRNLLWLNFSVPHAVSNMAKEAKRVYPYAVSLMETVRTYGQTLDLIEGNKAIEMLVAEHRNNAQKMISRGMSLQWQTITYDAHRMIYNGLGDGRENKQHAFVREFAGTVSVLQDKSNSLIDSYKEITRVVDELSTCAFTSQAFSDLLVKVQASIDRLNLEGYANLDHWVAQLDGRVEEILLVRLREIIQAWCREFDRTDDFDSRRVAPLRDATNKRRTEKRIKDEKASEGQLTLKPIVHEIRIQNQVIFLDPPIESARALWIGQLHEWIGIVCRQRRLQSSRYEIGLQMRAGSSADPTFTSLLGRLQDGALEKPFALIEMKVQEVKDYVAKWLQFQSLWDLEAEYVFNRLGDSLANWQQLLTEIKKTRSTFDNSESERSFGVIVIDYDQVQAKVNAKYDSWQRDILSRFGVKLGNEMKEMYSLIQKARQDLESHSIDGLVAGGPRRF